MGAEKLLYMAGAQILKQLFDDKNVGDSGRIAGGRKESAIRGLRECQ